MTEDDNAKSELFSEVVMPLIVGVFIFAAPAVIGLQIYWFLKFGTWTPLTVRDGLDFVSQSNWKFSWIGVKKIAQWFPLSASLAILSLLPVAIAKSLDK